MTPLSAGFEVPSYNKFDGIVRFAPHLAKLGDKAYELSMALNVASTDTPWLRTALLGLCQLS